MKQISLTNRFTQSRLLALALLTGWVAPVSAMHIIFQEDFESFPANAIDTPSVATDLSQISDWRSTDSSTQRNAAVRIDADGLLGPPGENQFLQFNIIDITWTTVHVDAANLFEYPTTAIGMSFDFYEPTGHNGDAYIFLTQNHAHIEKSYSWIVKITLNDGTLKVRGREESIFADAYNLDTANSIAVFVNNSVSAKTYTWEDEERQIASERIHLYLNGELLVDNLIRNRNFIQNVVSSLNVPLDAFTLQNAPAEEGNLPGQNIYYDNFVVYDLGGQITFTYEGREPDAPWRAEALAEIDKHRKGPLSVQAVGSDGHVVDGARIGYSMTRHAFDFSTLVSSNTFLSDHPNFERYRRITEHFFNGGSDAGGTRWPAWVGDLAWQNWSQQKTLDTYRWLKDRGMNTRVLTTIYQGVHLPRFIRDKIGTPAQTEIPADVDAHLVDIMGRLGPYVDKWEVINETAATRNLMQMFGEMIAVDWYKRAHELVPHARLAINENSIIGGVQQWRSDYYFNQIQFLVNNNAPLHSIGFQGHHRTIERLTPPASMPAIFDRFSVFGIPIAITEFDLETPDNIVQADYTRDFLIASFAHPAVDSFLIFGFWAGEHWRPQAAMFNLDWSPKPNFYAYHDLVYGDWWTRLSGNSDEMGNFTDSAFFGNYRVLAMDGNRYGSVDVTFRALDNETAVLPSVVPMTHTAVFPSNGSYGRILAKADFSNADILTASRIGIVGYNGDGRVWHSFLHYPIGQNELTSEAITNADRIIFRTGAFSKTHNSNEDVLGGTDLAVWVALQNAPVAPGFANSFDIANLSGAAEIIRLHRESIRILPDENNNRVIDPVLLDIEVDLTDFLAAAKSSGALADGKVLTIGLMPADVLYIDPETGAYNTGNAAFERQRTMSFSLSTSFVGLEHNSRELFITAPWINQNERASWLGRVDLSQRPAIWSDILGWIWTSPDATDAAVIFYDYPMQSWAYTTHMAFPWIYYPGNSIEAGWYFLGRRFDDLSWLYSTSAGWQQMDH